MRLRADTRLRRHAAGPQGTPIFVRAQSLDGELEDHARLEGDIEIRHDGVVLRGEHALYDFARDEIHLRENVRMSQGGATFSGPGLDLRLEAGTGRMPNASYRYAAKDGTGKADLIEFLDPYTIRLSGATYSTCDPTNPSWWIRAETLEIDRVGQDAVARHAALYFEGVPVFASPYFDLPLSDQRRSGMLTPGFYQNSRLGQEFIVPIYWNIAPNRDYTFTPDLIPRRGLLMGNEFRYLEPHWRGQFNLDLLPNDRTTGNVRDHYRFFTQYASGDGLAFNADASHVSDDNYLIDFSHSIVTASPQVLPQDMSLSLTRSNWDAGLRFSRSQTLVTLLAANDPGPYERVPELNLHAHREDLSGFDLEATLQATRFQHPAINPLFVPPAGNGNLSPGWYSQDGARVVANPVIDYRFQAPGYFVVPRLQWHSSFYELDPNYHAGSSGAGRNLPIASLDSGLIFEREAQLWGHALRQTLEPRVFYAWAPYRDQSSLPNFDSADADFNFAQLFSENTFTGSDRIAEANQLTTAVESRILDGATGAERLHLALGQRFYFGTQRVTLPGEVPRTNLSSDVLFLARAGEAPRWSVDMGLDYSTLTRSIALGTVGVRWQPKPASVVNLGYRYVSGTLAGTLIDQLRASAQWPISRRWYGVGALDYSIGDRAWVESVGGLEYKADCWVGRFVVSRYAVALPNSAGATTNTTTTAWFFQIELNGLTSVGTSPLDQLQRSIPGFQRLNPRSAPPGPFEHYE